MVYLLLAAPTGAPLFVEFTSKANAEAAINALKSAGLSIQNIFIVNK